MPSSSSPAEKGHHVIPRNRARPSYSLMLSWKTSALDPIESEYTYHAHTRRLRRARRSIDNSTPRTMRFPPPFVQQQQIDAERVLSPPRQKARPRSAVTRRSSGAPPLPRPASASRRPSSSLEKVDRRRRSSSSVAVDSAKLPADMYRFNERQRKIYDDFTAMLADDFDLYMMHHILDDALEDARRKTMLADYSCPSSSWQRGAGAAGGKATNKSGDKKKKPPLRSLTFS